MSKILLIGYNPPPFQLKSKVEAAHYRTWQFLQPLLEEGYTVCLCVDCSSQQPAANDMPKNLLWQFIPFDTIGWTSRLQTIHDSFWPDCVVAVDFYPSLYATKLRTSKPIWMDLYGDPLTISQLARYRTGSDQGIRTAIALMAQVLRRGDAFSTCGLPQRHALVGELAMCGRLNSHTFGYNFVEVIYPGAPPVETVQDKRLAERIALNLPGVDQNAFVVLWCGGFNTWTDVSTLYKALEWAMDCEPCLHFIAVGASTYKAAQTTYDQFSSDAAQSRHAARFHLLGWQPWVKIPRFYAASDVGISIDALHYETIYGTRTRLVEMLAYGLPVISSEGCELSYMLRDKSCGLTFSPGDWCGLGRHILQLAADRATLVTMRHAARAVASQDWSFRATVQPLLEWVRAPRLAPDNRARGFSTRLRAARFGMRTMARMLLWQVGLSGRQT